MLFLLVLVVAYGVVRLLPARGRWDERDRWRLALGAGMVAAGLLHLLTPAPFLQHLPPWVPAREFLVFATGLIEIAFGPALWFARGDLRRKVGWALTAFFVAVFPGNLYVALAGVDVQGQPGGPYPWLRLPMQALFIWLALWCTRAIGARPGDARLPRGRTRPKSPGRPMAPASKTSTSTISQRDPATRG